MLNPFKLSYQVLKEISSDLSHSFPERNSECIGMSSEDVQKLLIPIISSVAIESYIAEYHHAKLNGLLNLDTLEKRVAKFHSIFDPARFFTHYPVLRDMLSDLVADTILFINEIMRNYKNDIYDIERTTGKRYGKLIDIKLGLGDLHNGKSVSTVEFEYGKLIYKPHSIRTDEYIDSIFEFLNPFLRFPVKTLKTIVRPEYGWQQYGTPTMCHSFEEIQRYYYRVGCYLGVFYILCTTDMHNENIIAHGEWPYFFDTETIITNRVNALDLDSKSIIESVLNTAVLPSYQKGGFYEVNFSAVFTDDVSAREIETVELSTDPQFDFVYKKVVKKLSSENNRVTLNGKPVGVTQVKDNLICGFKDTLTSIKNNITSFISLISDPMFDDMKIRQVLRPTKVYAKFISAALNPKSLKSSDSRDKIFEILAENFGPSNQFAYSRVDAEINWLKKGYIPSFFTHYGDRNIYDASKLICNNYYQHTCKEVVINKCQRLSDDLIRYQTKLINLSLETLFRSSDVNEFMTANANLNFTFSKDKANLIINKYFEYVLNDISDISPNESSFVLLENEWDSLVYRYGAPGLYHFGGLVWFLIFYAKYYNGSAFEKIHKLFRYFANLYIGLYQRKERINYSLYEGFGSLAYISYTLFQTTQNKVYYDFSQNIASEILSACTNGAFENRFFDFINGAIGILSSICKLEYKNTFSDKFDSIIEYILSHTAHISQLKLDGGLAHGLSGVIFCLANLYLKKADTRILARIRELIEWEDSLIKGRKLGYSWCKGILGIALARLEVIRCLPSNSLAYSLATADLQRISVCDDMFKMGTPCLCHGVYGSFDILNTLHYYGKVNFDIDSFSRFLYSNDLTNLKWFKSTDAPLDSAMIGSSGLAYTLMRIVHPDIPSFLSLDVFKENGNSTEL